MLDSKIGIVTQKMNTNDESSNGCRQLKRQ